MPVASLNDPGEDVGRSRGAAWFGGVLARDVVQECDDPALLDRGGWWAVMATFEGRIRLWRFARTEHSELPVPGAAWPGTGAWTSSMDRVAYVDGVGEIRRRIREGDVYQVNLCRILTAPTAPGADPWALAGRLAAGNPSPYAGVLDVPAGPTGPAVRLVTASPELFLRREQRELASSPIKGTGATAADLLPKDDAENVMIVDLVRNDFAQICAPGSVAVPSLLAREQHPGLVHLVSTVTGTLAPRTGWAGVLSALLPPASVSGAPRISALRAIADLEPTARGPYCGVIGWVDGDRGRARLAVGIRTFWLEGSAISFGTGAGITWGSDAEAEWRETELKAARLVALAGDTGSSEGEPDRIGGALGGRNPVSAHTAHRVTPGVQEATA